MPDNLSSLTLSCIGAGRLGKTLCHLFAQHLHIGHIINCSEDSARLAVKFIGAGQARRVPVDSADIWLIATPDNEIKAASAVLRTASVLRESDTVFHCSGALNAAELDISDCHTASVHPIHSFADPQQSISQFAGTPCGMEGNRSALDRLQPLFERVAAKPFVIDSQQKALYHAATVMTCNYLVSLLELGQKMLTAAGVSPQQGVNPLEPLIRQTLDNYFNTDAISALTGPISRGDTATVASHIQALQQQPNNWQQVYRALGNTTRAIAAKQGQASAENLSAIDRLLNSGTDHHD
ncbi:MAG: DUF2520 domain-containing protein [Porticoccaceae bacterium]|jgi:predicted short-subunit dehydrogenase-like oxidoreductase (DUF2520 family)